MRMGVLWTAMGLIVAIAGGLACGGSDDDKADTAKQPAKEAGAGAPSTAGTSAPAAGAGGAAETRGSCPEGYICKAVLFPVGEHLCMEGADAAFAPSCVDNSSCAKLPGSMCVDGGIGLVCYLSCKP